MSEVQARYARVADGFTTRLEGVPSSAWDEATPCPDWSARELVAHVVDTHRRVLSTLDGSDPVPVASDGELSAAWGQAAAAVREALDDPALAATTVGGMFAEQPFESLVGRLLCADTVIHTWDLARATGQAEDLDPAAVEMALEFLTPIDAAIRRPGGFGPKIESPPGADTQTRLLNLAGRAV